MQVDRAARAQLSLVSRLIDGRRTPAFTQGPADSAEDHLGRKSTVPLHVCPPNARSQSVAAAAATC
jgi:hypothetical protein